MPVVAQKGGIVFTFTCRQWAAMDAGGGWTAISEDCNGQDAELPRTPFASAASGTSTSGTSGSAGDKNYVHVQGTAAAVWYVAHNLGKYPSVVVIDSSGRKVIGEVEYTDANNMVLTFSGAFAGTATFN